MDNNEAQEYIDEFARRSGVWPKPGGDVPDFHKIMARHDFPVLQAQNALGAATYGAERTLDPVTKELIFLAMFTAMRCSHYQLTAHVKMALDLGVSSQQILETMEMVLPVGGIVAFLSGFEAWREVTNAPGLEPSANVTRRTQ
jgi:4-carboxymuconolactone decarboxylase